MSEEKEKQVEEVLQSTQTQILSQLYVKICNCRRDYPELDQLLEPKFHLEDCPYRGVLANIGITFENE